MLHGIAKIRNWGGNVPIVLTYNQTAFGEYEEDEAAVTLRNSGGDCGGGSEVLIVLQDDATPKIGGATSAIHSRGKDIRQS